MGCRVKTDVQIVRYRETERLKRLRDPIYRAQRNAAKRATPSYSKEYRLKKRLALVGWSIDDYFSALERQGGRCAICPRTEPGRGELWFVDHDHKTGKARGLLCLRCNLLLGHACDSPVVLDAAARYLRRDIGEFHG